MDLNTLVVDKEPLYLIKVLQEAGFDAYIVGGAVRDLLLDMRSEDQENDAAAAFDYDLTTNAKPEEILGLFPDAFYENDFGTVMITPEDLRAQFNLPRSKYIASEDGDKFINLAVATKIHESIPLPGDEIIENSPEIKERNFEITTYRSEGAYQDHRRPEEVEWGETLDQDLERRDFTINAMALEIPADEIESLLAAANDHIEIRPDQYRVVDPHGGLQDLEAGLIKTVGNPDDRFAEDALRILRAIRFSVQLNMQIDDKTYEAIIKHRELLKHISWERISTEFLKMIGSNYPREAIELLDDTGLLELILPELIKSKGVEQGGHHTTDVWTHSLDALAACPSSDPVVRLATLLHDIAKPDTYNEADGSITFYNHEVVGSRIAKKVAQRLRFSKRNQERIFTLVRFHMFHYQPENSDASIRRFMRKVGLENIDDILDLREADRLGSGARRTSWRLEEMKQRMLEQLHQPLAVKDLAINGHDLMSEFGLEPGPEIGRILKQLFEIVLDEPELNNKETLLGKAKTLIGT